MKIYCINLDVIDKKIDNLLMDKASNKSKISKFNFYSDLRRSLYGEMLARYMIIKEFNIKNNDIKFSYIENGKPIYTNQSEVHFNISHSENYVVGCIDINEVGIDIEYHSDIYLDLFDNNTIFSIEENNFIHKNGIKTPFFNLWVLKESYLKYLGNGLLKALNEVNFVQNGTLTNNVNFNKFNTDKNVRSHLINVFNNYSLAYTGQDNFEKIENVDQNNLEKLLLNK